MKIRFLWIGKTKDKSFSKIIEEYQKRIDHYCSVEIHRLKDPKAKSRNREEIKKVEAELILSKIKQHEYVVLLDERGNHLTSDQLADWVQHKMNISISDIVFIIAGAFGASQTLKDRADYTFSLSHLTLTHDMARIFILEQTYRAFSIIKGEKYHNP